MYLDVIEEYGGKTCVTANTLRAMWTRNHSQILNNATNNNNSGHHIDRLRSVILVQLRYGGNYFCKYHEKRRKYREDSVKIHIVN